MQSIAKKPPPFCTYIDTQVCHLIPARLSPPKTAAYPHKKTSRLNYAYKYTDIIVIIIHGMHGAGVGYMDLSVWFFLLYYGVQITVVSFADVYRTEEVIAFAGDPS